jgi:hypothetical protein
MTVASMIALILTAVIAAPLYFKRFEGSRMAQHRFVVPVLLALLGLAAMFGVLGTDSVAEVVYPLAVLAAALGGGPVTVAILQVSFNKEHPEHKTEDVEETPVLRGGAWIGVLERTAISVTLLAHWPEGLAVVLAVKGLGRYSELGKSGAAERFILGTFASVLWAAAAAGIAFLNL